MIFSSKMLSANTFLILLTVISINSCHGIKLRFPTWSSSANRILTLTDISYDYNTYFYTQPVDHFSYTNADTFQQRYLVADQFWDSNAGTVFFYTGNEGDIEMFCNNTGLMWDWAEEFKALLVFAEHRYYGKSLPYGEYSYKDPKHLGYLTSEQALADFAVLITHLRSSYTGVATRPLIAFGGSYGGMLAAWIRMKYPHLVSGSLAASAPVWQFAKLVPCGVFYEIVTKDFQRAAPNCAQNIKRSWKVLTKMADKEQSRAVLSSTLRLCDPAKSASDVQKIKDWLSEIWVNLAMVDYPYPANFLEPLPAWPVKAVCSHLSQPTLTDLQLVNRLASALNVYFNMSGTAQCFNASQQSTPDLGVHGWDFQACTEIVMPMCSNGVDDMFEPTTWNYTQYAAQCKKQWGVIARPDWVIEQYGGKDIHAASNIIFSNGDLDPWSGGGVKSSLSESLIAIAIADGAHHLDLRASNPLDPASVTAARQKEKEIIHEWIKQWNKDTMVYTASATVYMMEDFMATALLFSGKLILLISCVVIGYLLRAAQQRQNYITPQSLYVK